MDPIAFLMRAIPAIPNALVDYLWPRLQLKAMLDGFLSNWPGVDPRILGRDMVAGFGTGELEEGSPEDAFSEIVLWMISDYSGQTGKALELSKSEVAPLMRALGAKILDAYPAP